MTTPLLERPALGGVAAANTIGAADPARFLALIGPQLDETEAVFRRHLASDVPFIHDAGVYISQGGGKRMRPALLLLCARLLDRLGPEAVTYAAVVELIHTATLIHDDIIDHAALRRGQRTVNHVWGNGQTVLLGDWIYTTAMQMSLGFDNLAVVKRLCDATLRMTEGELLSLRRLGSIDLRSEEYFSIVERKTARLFSAACSLPALIEPRRPEAEEALAAYGWQLGLCFQLVDDLLDFTARERELGKPVLSDLKEGRLTLPLILALPRLDARRRAIIENVLTDRAFTRTTPEEILELVQREGTIDEVARLAEQAARAAQEQLARLPAGEVSEALELAPEFVLHRRS
jgi:octaprenyl-diphosphate synthase